MKYFSRLLFLLLLLLFLCEVDAQERTCFTPAQVAPITASLNPDPLNGDYCVTVYIEVDNDIVVQKGGIGPATTYIEGLLSEVAALYQADDITLSFIVKYWETESPYTASTSGGMLDQFRAYRTANGGHDGDVAQLLSYRASGGIAYVDVICRGSFGYAFSSISSGYNRYPSYSWSVEVIAHELGHNLGSPHTHACVWNGNNTAIDDLSPFGTEGGCTALPPPVDGATVMSYGHLTPTGINFLKGFGPQPLSLVKNRIAAANCVECIEDPDEPDTIICSDNQIIVEIQLDNYPQETSWHVLDEDGDVVGESEPYAKLQMNTYHADTLCLPDGCYSFVINDIDGIEGFGCGEGLYIVNSEDGEVASGQAFINSEITKFCLNTEPPADDCETIPIKASAFTNYANQHRGGTIEDIPGGVVMDGNTWKVTKMLYSTTPRSILKGDIFIETRGEIHGIGLVLNNGGLAPSQIFRLGGTQNWGREVEQAPIGEWYSFEIPVGQLLALYDYPFLVLVNDHDPNGAIVTRWRNIELCEDGAATGGMGAMWEPISRKSEEEMIGQEEEGRTILKGYQPYLPAEISHWIRATNPCTLAHPHPNGFCPTKSPEGTMLADLNYEQVQLDINQRVKKYRKPYPNPTDSILNLDLEVLWHLSNNLGQIVGQGWGKTVDMSKLPPGIYLLHDGITKHKIVKQ